MNRKILVPQAGTIKKLTTFVPKADAAEVRNALFAAGAGSSAIMTTAAST